MTREELEEMARRSVGRGQKQLEEQLRQMASPDRTREAEREGAAR